MSLRLPSFVTRALLRLAMRVIARDPDFAIGDGYLYRWHLLRSRFACLYVHVIAADDDHALHDHRSWNVSLLLAGGYAEHTPGGTRIRTAGDVVVRRATDLHRLQLLDGVATTLFFTGPHRRAWGFQTPEGWVRHDLYVHEREQ